MANFPLTPPDTAGVPVSPTTVFLGASSPAHSVLHQRPLDEIKAIADALGYQAGGPAGTLFADVTAALTFLMRGMRIQTIAAAGTAQTFDLSLGASKIVTLTSAACTLATPTNLIAPVGGGFFVNFVEMTFKQDATGSRTVNWWSGIRWPGGGVAPTLTTTPSTGRDKVVAVSYDGGTSGDADFALGLA